MNKVKESLNEAIIKQESVEDQMKYFIFGISYPAIILGAYINYKYKKTMKKWEKGDF